MSLWSYFLIIPLRIIRGFFDILIMNIPKNFVKKIEPYSFCGCFEIDLKYQRDISVNYQPSKYSEEEGKLILPVVKIDDKNIDLVCDLNLDSVNEAFREYCIHFISISFYSFLIFIIIFIMSYKTTMLWPLLLMFIALTVLIPAVKIYKEYTHMKKVKNKILELMRSSIHKNCDKNKLLFLPLLCLIQDSMEFFYTIIL